MLNIEVKYLVMFVKIQGYQAKKYVRAMVPTAVVFQVFREATALAKEDLTTLTFSDPIGVLRMAGQTYMP